MGIKDKQTYGEYYWAMQVEASKMFADESEKVVAPYISRLLGDIPIIDEMPSGIKSFLSGISEPHSFAFLPFLSGVGLNAVDEALDIAFEGSMTWLKRNYKKRYKSTWLTSAEVNTLLSRQKITEGLWDEVIASEGYEAVLGSSLYEAQLPYPSIPDLMLYSRYHDDPDNPWSELSKWFKISPREFPVWNWLGKQRLTADQVHTLYRRKLITPPELFDNLAQIGWHAPDRPLIEELNWIIPNAMLLVQGDLHQNQSRDYILEDISVADINPKYAQTYLDAILTKPASQDLVAYELRRDPSLSSLPQRLTRIGIHPEYTEVYKELAYQIPPVADIITMAVREAFTPDIAARFGQYEDYPSELTKWGQKKGLSEEWTQRYWAAHWALPSPQQGFEMLHRGIINQTELTMLLRALDVMPFWRDKLVEMAYRRLTRVDVRRMYRVGVLTEAEVYEAYLQQGYNPKNAKRMSDFTIKQTLETLSKFSSKDVVNAFTKRMISRSEAHSLLIEIGVRSEDASYIISTAEYKRLWAFTESRIKGISNLYRKGVYDENQTRDKLSRLDLPADQINVLMEQWYHDKIAEPTNTWTTSQTLGFLKDNLITKQRAITELRLNGYDTEHINIYIQSLE